MSLDCYSGKITNDKNREIRITAIGMDLDDSKKVKVFSTVIPLRDTLPAMPREVMAGRKRDKTNVFAGGGNLAGISQGNVTLTDKMATITVGDDLVFNLGSALGAPTSSILKNMLTGEIFRSSTSSTLGVVPLGVAGNVVDATGTCPSMVLGQDWKYLLAEDLKLFVPYGRGATKNNTFMDTASSTQIGIMIEYKTTYGDGTVTVVRYAGACGGNIQDNSADDLNKFSVDLDIYSDAREYSNYFIAGGYNFDVDTAAAVKNIQVTGIIVPTSVAGAGTISTSTTTVTASEAAFTVADVGKYITSGAVSKKITVFTSATQVTIESAFTSDLSTASYTIDMETPTDYGVSGNLVASVTSAGAVKIYKSNGSSTWTEITGTLIAGAKIFSKKRITSTIASATTNWEYISLKVGGVGSGTAVATTVTVESGTGYTLATTYTYPMMDFDFVTRAFIPYIG